MLKIIFYNVYTGDCAETEPYSYIRISPGQMTTGDNGDIEIAREALPWGWEYRGIRYTEFKVVCVT